MAVLAQRDEANQPFVIVGGQAVNLWAERYRPREPRLDAFLPFTSKDLDLVGSTAAARRTAAVVGWQFVPPAADAFVMQGKLRHGELLVEFLRPEGADLFPPGRVEAPVAGQTLTLRVLAPPVLLMKKVALATDVPQAGVEDEIAPRQDVRHVQMLALLFAHYLQDTVLDAAAVGATPAARRDAMQPLVALLAGIKRSGSGRRFEAAYPGVLPWGGLLPAAVRLLPFDDVHQRCLAELA